MWHEDLGIDIIVQTLKDEIEQYTLLNAMDAFKKSISLIEKRFPNCESREIMDILQMACKLYDCSSDERCELVITAPSSFKLKARKTKLVVNSILSSAEKSITLTGYSISEYFSEMIELIIQKSTQGVYVNLYLNDTQKHQDVIERLNTYASKFIKIFSYNQNSDDKMSALHAKLIVVDGHTSLISSANLSYHGMQGNVEMGVLIESTGKAQAIESLLKTLREQKVFTKFK
ncbi:MAG TPA: phospholipase [Clostridiales bacterium]|nr:phospholipase [Clostridiales bacterium]